MLIYGPQPEAEYVPVLGGLTEEEKGLFESRLRALVPALRFLTEADEDGHPAIRRFLLKLHREDRVRATAAVHEVMERIRPPLSRIEAPDQDIAALVRQFARAHEADDRPAARLMRGYPCREIEYLLTRLLERAKVAWAVDLWLDGVSAQECTFVPPLGLDVRGHVDVVGPSGFMKREPLEAELRASKDSPALEWFNARFGDRTRLAAEGVIRADAGYNHPSEVGAYRVRIGSSVTRHAGQLVEWAFEFTKS